MNVYIPDDIDPNTRREILNIYPVIYAIRHCNGSMKAAAEFLGLSIKGLSERMTRYRILHGLKKKRFYHSDGMGQEDISKINKDPLRKIYNYHLHKSMKSFWWNTCSQKEKEEFLARMTELYGIMTH